MDRRQKKTRKAIFGALIALLSQKSFERITVGDIIERADVGRATFYAHFETKDFLLRELCKELFCHIFDAVGGKHSDHEHIFDCEAPHSVFLHLLRHLQKNDNNVLALLAGENNELFLRYFKAELQGLVKSQLPLFEQRRSPLLPEEFWVDHITETFLATVKWWAVNGMKEGAEEIAEYFYLAV